MSVLIQLEMMRDFNTRIGALSVALIGVITGGIIVLYAMIKWKIITSEEWQHLPFGSVMNKLMRE